MEKVSIKLPSSGKSIEVQLERKQMKTCRIKVYPDQTVVLSLPTTVPYECAESFLNEKGGWIETKLDIFKRTSGYAATTEIKNGYSVKMLGEDMLFSVSECNYNRVYLEGKTIHICTTTPADQERLVTQFESWWKKQAEAIITDRVEYWYPVIKKYGVEKPQLYIRKMRTLWGSCSVPRQAITFNFYLIKARIPYIDYVVLHELVHFLYPNHSKQFYAFLSNYMPDWKERKQVLDQEVVHGL